MAFTEAQLIAQLDPAGHGRGVTLIRSVPFPTGVSLFLRGIIAPYAGRAQWVDVLNTKTAAQAAAQIIAAFK
jgi:hypothetical protein